jgi:hypothetical protein
MHDSESRATGSQRFIWISVFAVALWLSLVNAGAAFAGGEHPSQGSSPEYGNANWQHDTEGSPTSWGDTQDEGHPPPEAPAPEQPCTEEQPPEETPPEETPPEEKPPGHEKPPVETPPVQTPPVETPVETPPVQTPPVQTQPVETPPVETPPVETPESPATPHSPKSPTSPVEEKGGGGVEVLPQEQVSGAVGGQEAPTATEATLPFTGSETPLLMLVGVGLLGLGVGLRRAVAERG